MNTAPPDDSDVLLPDALAEVVRHLEKYTEPFLPSPVVVEVSESSKVAALQSTPLMPQFHSPWPLPSLASRNRGGVGLRLEATFSSARP